MILNAAFDIVRKDGIEKLSNLELEKRLNCSIRPIYYQFKNVEDKNVDFLSWYCNFSSKWFD